MKIADGRLIASPTDLANFLVCAHKTSLDLLVAEGRLSVPAWVDPLANILRERGDEHERRYVASLVSAGLDVVDLNPIQRDERPARTLQAMRAGADVIVQAGFVSGGWIGYADVLRKVPVPSPELGDWSYEVHDTKLAREIRGGTILQLCVYSDLVGELQGRVPERFLVVTPAGEQAYRFDDFAAFYRQTKERFRGFLLAASGPDANVPYPQPIGHCDVCRWAGRCTARRRSDDDVSFVAGMGRTQRVELAGHDVTTLKSLATLARPLPFVPSRGSTDTYVRLHEQARLQLIQRTTGRPTWEPLPIETDFGLSRLPEPRAGDLFLDLEGDPFARQAPAARPGETGREYLFGLGRVGSDGRFEYRARWAFTDGEEHAAFDTVMDEIMRALEVDPAIHIYHYAPYEPSAFKRLMGRYAAREADLDRLLRGRRFVDLYAIVRHALRAGVESYSIKSLEPFYRFTREVELDAAGDRRRIVELALETGDLTCVTGDVRASVEGYNKDDCRSTLELRDWLEMLRRDLIASGTSIERPPLEPGEAPEDVSARQQRVNDLRARLLENVPPEAVDRTRDEQARYLLSYLLDWHYREDKVVWWEYFRLAGLSDDELIDEPAAVAGLQFVGRVDEVRHKTTGKPTGSVVDRYAYPLQECEIGRGDGLRLRDDTRFGEVVAVDRLARTFDVKKSAGVVDLHPLSAFAFKWISPEPLPTALFRFGERVADAGLAAMPGAATDLLLRQTMRNVAVNLHAPVVDEAVRLVLTRPATCMPIQGPPGSGKTFTGAKMICALVKEGRRVGVTATSHKVIRNLLEAVAKEAAKSNETVRIGQRVKEISEQPAPGGIMEIDHNGVALSAVGSGSVHVLGGTAWLWAREDFANAVDVLFIDEAGQMSLANAVAVSQAARTIVLLGDPQQLEQPQKGSHPDGVDVSAMDQVLEGHKTMPPAKGLFLPVTWRLAPAICAFTSELFYENKLEPKPGLGRQRLIGAGRFDGAGLFCVEVEHSGCRNASDAEVDVVDAIVRELTAAGVKWIDEDDKARDVRGADILVVAPFNAHVNRLHERLANSGARVGTVDKFQGQEAPIVIYSMATSRPEDAPRGLEFLFSLNRLNVATSRARCACILVASPRLFEADCQMPRQMQLANALARYREMGATDSATRTGTAGRP